MNALSLLRSALKYEAEITAPGKLELAVPFPAGSRVAVYVIGADESEFLDLVSTTPSSFDFWENPIDDEDWNDA